MLKSQKSCCLWLTKSQCILVLVKDLFGLGLACSVTSESSAELTGDIMALGKLWINNINWDKDFKYFVSISLELSCIIIFTANILYNFLSRLNSNISKECVLYGNCLFLGIFKAETTIFPNQIQLLLAQLWVELLLSMPSSAIFCLNGYDVFLFFFFLLKQKTVLDRLVHLMHIRKIVTQLFQLFLFNLSNILLSLTFGE